MEDIRRKVTGRMRTVVEERFSWDADAVCDDKSLVVERAKLLVGKEDQLDSGISEVYRIFIKDEEDIIAGRDLRGILAIEGVR